MHERPHRERPFVLIWLLGLLGAGCATLDAPPPRSYEYFVPSSPNTQSWYEKVENWQQRSQRDVHARPGEPLYDPGDPAVVPREGQAPPLRVQMNDFADTQKREVARAINQWSQRVSRWHYKKDVDDTPATDQWPTFGELLRNDGDDCDGLDLISYQLLLQFGFPPDRVYRAVFERESDGVNHMVTLWFESPSDPWVLDATRAASRDMEKLSAVKGWAPVVMFNQERLYDIVQPESTP